MGMGRIALLRQVSIESLLLALLGGVFGVGLAVGIVKLFRLIAGHAVPRLDNVTAGWAVLAWGLGVAVLASMLAALFPALRALRLDPMEVLKNAGPKGTAGLGERRLLRGVTIAQTALTLALLVGAGLLIRTMINIARVPSGYNTSHILTMSVTDVRSFAEWANFHKPGLATGLGNPRRAIRGIRVGSAAYRKQLAGDNGNRRAATGGQGERQDRSAAARCHRGLFQANGPAHARGTGLSFER
jgi:putative ABC transport system permease protein